MIVEFIGHAGFRLTCSNGLEILIDPWFTNSDLENPVIQSLNECHKTIDYGIPSQLKNKEDFNPQIILCSHFHTHHASKTDYLYFVNKCNFKIKLVFPSDAFSESAQKNLDFFERHEIHQDQHLKFDSVSIHAFTHTVKGHIGFYIFDSLSQTSFMHIADAPANRNPFDRRLDPVWLKLKELSVDFLVLSGGAISSSHFINSTDYSVKRRIPNTENPENWQKILRENEFMSPAECANLTNTIFPRIACLMGMYNFSIWKQRIEFGFSASENENYFSWCLSEISPEIKSFPLRPGNKINLIQLKQNNPYISI